jgi:tetratricopeptide (TPR) repeat protein
MLAHHYLQALELSEAAGADTSSLVEPARRAFAEAGDRAAALFAVQSAERFYDAALRLWPEDDPERAQLLFRRAQPAGRHFGGGDPEQLAVARDALLAAGETAKAAEAETILSQTHWIRGRRELADVHAERAEVLLQDAPPSRSSAWVRARLAARAGVQGDSERAIEIALLAKAEGEELGWDEVVGDALTTIGSFRVELGHVADGMADLERALELAAGTGSLGVLTRAYNNLSVVHQTVGDLEAGYEARRQGAAVAERLGSSTQITWFEGILGDFEYRLGDWSRALERADGVIGGAEGGSTHYVASQAYFVRGLIRLGHNETPAAKSDAEHGLDLANANDDPQSLSFALTAAAYIFDLAGDSARAAELARTFLQSFREGRPMGFAVLNLPMFASTALRLGLGDELTGALARHVATRWFEVVRAYVAGDFAAAAEILVQTGSKPEEAEARLRAAERLVAEGRRAEADEQLRQAIDFYRSVRATRYIREGEALLAASA